MWKDHITTLGTYFYWINIFSGITNKYFSGITHLYLFHKTEQFLFLLQSDWLSSSAKDKQWKFISSLYPSLQFAFQNEIHTIIYTPFLSHTQTHIQTEQILHSINQSLGSIGFFLYFWVYRLSKEAVLWLNTNCSSYFAIIILNACWVSFWFYKTE